MEYGECARCGAAFPQRPGKGRPRKFCDLHRRNRKYGSRHEALRRDTIAQAYGKPCVRCGNELTPGNVLGEPELDHSDSDDGTYLGYSHSRCNRSAGAVKGNANPSAAQMTQRARWAASRGPTPSRRPSVPPSRSPVPDDGRLYVWAETAGWTRVSRLWG